MRNLRRTLAVLFFLLALLVGLGCLAGIVGLWVARPPLLEKTQTSFTKIDRTLGLAEKSLKQAGDSLARAATRLEEARQEQQQLATGTPQPAVARRMLARTLHQKVAPEISDAQAALHTVAEAAVVVNAVLEDAADFKLVSASGMDLSGLEQLNGRLAGLANQAWDVGRLFEAAEADPAAVEACRSRVAATLTALKAIIAEYEPRVIHLRQQAATLRERLLMWITPAAFLLTGLLVWLAYSQGCVMLRARQAWRESEM